FHQQIFFAAGISHTICEGVLRRAKRAFLGVSPPGINKNEKLADATKQTTRPNRQRDQTNIKQINRIARHQRHHLVALDAQMSKKFKTEKPVNRAFPFNETHERNSEP